MKSNIFRSKEEFSLIDLINKVRARDRYEEQLEDYVNKSFKNVENQGFYIYNSNRIEGSSLSLGKTLELLETGDYRTVEQREVLGLRRATDYLKTNYCEEFNYSDLILLHTLLMEPIREAIAGKIRRAPAYTYVEAGPGVIRKHFYEQEDKVEGLMEDLFGKKVSCLEDVIHFKLELASIHPFTDGNGRVSRLVLNWLLIQTGYPPITIKDKGEYLAAMSASTVEGNVQPFEKLVLEHVFEVYTTW